MDGLAAGVTGVIALAYIIFPGSTVGLVGCALAWSLLGACIGFLIFNFPPQKYLWATQAAKCSASASHSSVWISSRQKAQATLRFYWHFPCWLRRCRGLTQF
jgi:hypothetical protein